MIQYTREEIAVMLPELMKDVKSDDENTALYAADRIKELLDCVSP